MIGKRVRGKRKSHCSAIIFLRVLSLPPHFSVRDPTAICKKEDIKWGRVLTKPAFKAVTFRASPQATQKFSVSPNMAEAKRPSIKEIFKLCLILPFFTSLFFLYKLKLFSKSLDSMADFFCTSCTASVKSFFKRDSNFSFF